MKNSCIDKFYKIGTDLSGFFGAGERYFSNIGFKKEDVMEVVAYCEKEYIIVLGVDVYSESQNAIRLEGVWALETFEGEGMYEKYRRSIVESQSFISAFDRIGLLFCLTIEE